MNTDLTCIWMLVLKLSELYSDDIVVRLRFLGKALSVERASKPTEGDKHKQSEPHLGKDSTFSVKDPPGKDLTAEVKLASLPGSEPIAERLGINYPFPPHLEYVVYFPLYMFQNS